MLRAIYNQNSACRNNVSSRKLTSCSEHVCSGILLAAVNNSHQLCAHTTQNSNTEQQ